VGPYFASRPRREWVGFQNRRIAGLREHRIDRRPNERVGRYAFFLSEHDQLRLFARFRLSFAVCRSMPEM
jgi:hypothetical protein